MRHAGDTADADGIDGSKDNAGAVLGPDGYGFFGERSKNRLDLPYVEIVRTEIGEKNDQAAAFFSFFSFFSAVLPSSPGWLAAGGTHLGR
jgi:hypothetical protein